MSQFQCSNSTVINQWQSILKDSVDKMYAEIYVYEHPSRIVFLDALSNLHELEYRTQEMIDCPDSQTLLLSAVEAIYDSQLVLHRGPMYIPGDMMASLSNHIRVTYASKNIVQGNFTLDKLEEIQECLKDPVANLLDKKRVTEASNAARNFFVLCYSVSLSRPSIEEKMSSLKLNAPKRTDLTRLYHTVRSELESAMDDVLAEGLEKLQSMFTRADNLLYPFAEWQQRMESLVLQYSLVTLLRTALDESIQLTSKSKSV